MKTLSRRGFFAATAAAGAAAGFFGARLVEYLGCAPDTPWRAFTAAELPVIDALAEQIVPADDMPGAREARVVRYIDWQLAPGAPYEGRREDYRKGLAELDALARRECGKGFAECAFEVQTALLERIDRGEIKEGTLKPFFDLVVRHVKQGFYGSPIHGGNEKYASYRMLGVAGPGCTGRNRPS